MSSPGSKGWSLRTDPRVRPGSQETDEWPGWEGSRCLCSSEACVCRAQREHEHRVLEQRQGAGRMVRGKGQARAMASLAAVPQLVSHLIPTFLAEGLGGEITAGQSTHGTPLAPVPSHSQALAKCPSCASYSTSPWEMV